MTHPSARIEDYGDAALLVTLGPRAEDAVVERVQRLATAIRVRRTMGVPLGAPVPGLTSVLVPYDSAIAAPVVVRDVLAGLVADLDVGVAPATGVDGAPLYLLEVRYGGPAGPDLPFVAERSGLTSDQVIELHASTEYRVQLLGFVPGFAYLATLPAALTLPRRASPRPRVAAGSVAIAGRRTAVYPSETPGGWHLIGRTDAPIWDPHRDPPALLRPGDRVRFVPRADG